MTENRKKTGLSVVIPAYNEAAVIGDFLASVKAALDRSGISHEVIVVDDRSDDGTRNAAASEGFTVISHSSRKGYGASLKTGIRAAKGERVAIIDADNTYRADDIARLSETTDAADMVVGERHDEKERPKDHLVVKKCVEGLLSAIFGQRVGDINSGLRVARREHLVKYLDLMPDGFSFTSTITLVYLLKGYRLLYVPIFYARRSSGSKLKRGGFVKAFVSSYVRVLWAYFRRKF